MDTSLKEQKQIENLENYRKRYEWNLNWERKGQILLKITWEPYFSVWESCKIEPICDIPSINKTLELVWWVRTECFDIANVVCNNKERVREQKISEIIVNSSAGPQNNVKSDSAKRYIKITTRGRTFKDSIVILKYLIIK